MVFCSGLGESLPRLVARSFVSIVLQGNAVDAIAQAGRIGPVGKDMPKMSFAIGASHLCPAHEKRAIFMLAHGAPVSRSIETRPAGAGIVFGFRAEQRGTTADAAIRARALLLRLGVAEGALGSMLARYPMLLRRESFTPLVIGFDDGAGFLHLCFQGFAHEGELFLFSCV